MKQKRAKAYKKQMVLYQHAFKFREPYQTIVDHEIILYAEKADVNLTKGLTTTIHGEVKPMITQCCMQALYDSKNQEAIEYAKTFERRRCNHPPTDPIPPSECIKSVVDVKGENKHRYVVATQDEVLRKKLKKVPGVPMVYVEKGVMIMAQLSAASARHAERYERLKLTGGLNQKKAGLNVPIGASKPPKPPVDGKVEKPKKKTGPKQPNPLSMKKKREEQKVQAVKTEEVQEDAKKRRRKRGKGDKSGTNSEAEGSAGEEAEEVAASE
ncbi:hypothetical protein BABINDRAFT_163227 [Babjeviella inositovora NRRL Y-12698]|uniref:U three protein 23 n=1 Tax=Babjeviella inositovora NRRL Y-12698 TaxID=984486 RepID=A0A1E3QLI4_9ASCO|nr:uncharacterized protein BABINDRAFT_163227 [Babjeviella inositovora NRRL Y-12698]ODQ77847.1 hypothetical protein BABINDRAFT_163227 [Babjeviella inositovora NRRL Y-12698]